jgi:hypothetical protein
MELTNRQKKIILVFASGLSLVILVIISVFLIFSKKNKSQNNPLPEENTNLEISREKIINEIEQKLNWNNIEESDLLNELKEKLYLDVSENNWRKYFNLMNDSGELEKRKKNILNIIDDLKKKFI